MFFVGRAIKSIQKVQNGPKISCGTHLLLECCVLIGLLGWGKIDLIRALNQSNLWRLCPIRSVDTKEKVHKSVQVSEVSASRS